MLSWLVRPEIPSYSMPEQGRKGRNKYHEVKKITLEKLEKFSMSLNKLKNNAVPYSASGTCRSDSDS